MPYLERVWSAYLDSVKDGCQKHEPISVSGTDAETESGGEVDPETLPEFSGDGSEGHLVERKRWWWWFAWTRVSRPGEGQPQGANKNKQDLPNQSSPLKTG